MLSFNSVCVLLVSIALCACAGGREAQSGHDTSLQQDFLKADQIQRGDVNPAEWNALRARLHARLRKEGDEQFAAALSALPLMDQVSVVNMMGFMNPSDYDNFPKTKHLLASAPKL